MSKFIARSAAIVGAVAIIGSGLALTAPTAGAATHYGTATVKEARKVVRQADVQRCLTRAEVRKIVKGEGHEFDVPGPSRGFDWSGRGEVKTLTVTFVHGCADFAMVDYRHNRTLSWADYNVGIGSPEDPDTY